MVDRVRQTLTVFHGHRVEKTLLIGGSVTWLHLDMLAMNTGNISAFEKALGEFAAYIHAMAKNGYKIESLYGAINFPSKDEQEFICVMKKILRCEWRVITATSLNSNTQKIDGMLEILGCDPALQYKDLDLSGTLLERTAKILGAPDQSMKVMDMLAKKAALNFECLKKMVPASGGSNPFFIGNL